MSRGKRAESDLTVERFGEVCRATRWNVRAALDLIFIHAEKEVHGRQPRASLNPLTVLSAAAAYERFFGDLYAAAKDSSKDWKPGYSNVGLGKDVIPGLRHESTGKAVRTGRQWLPESLGKALREARVVHDLTSYWEMWMAEGWFGASPTDWAFKKYSEDPEAFSRALHDARHARDGAAHFLIPTAAARSKVGFEPILIPDGSLFAKRKKTWDYGWDGDAKSDTVQSGFARGATALFIQLIDSSIVAVADSHNWSSATYRLPEGWFAAEVPSSDSRYARAQFWGGQALHRVRPVDRSGAKETR